MKARTFTSGSWSIEIPGDWSVESGTPVSIVRRDGVGALQITSTQKTTGSITKEDVDELVAGEAGKTDNVSFGAFQGVTLEHVSEGRFLQKWWLVRDSLLLFLTYNCQEKDQEIDQLSIRQMLGSLQVRQRPAAS